MMKRQSSAKNSPISACLIAMEMHVHDSEIVAKIQNIDVAAFLSVPTQPGRRFDTSPRMRINHPGHVSGVSAADTNRAV